MLKKTLVFALSAALLAFSLAGCAGNSSDSAKASNTDSQEKTEQAAGATEGASAAPITADKVADGTYSITVDSSSNMFKIVDAQLIVENGSMHCVMTLSGTGYGKLFMGTGDEAAAASEADFIPYVENAEGKYTYDVPVEALDEDTACAAWSIKKEQWYDRTLVFESAGALPFAGCSASPNATGGTAGSQEYTVNVSLSGGSGRASIASPTTIVKDGDAYTATITWSSSNYDKMTVDGVDYAPVNDGGNSTFEIPVTLDEDIAVSAETVAMSTPHTIDYTLHFDSSTMKEKSGDDASGGSPAGTASSAAADFHNADLGCGWEPTGALQLEYAEHFTVDEFEGGLRLICVSNGERFLVVPQDAKAPDGLSSDIAVIRRPADKVYLVSSATMCLVDALDANDNILMSGTKADDCSVAGFKSALESGAIAYGGKYSAPDYERISASGCTLAIENTMINHTPDVKEKLQKLGLVVLTEQSSSEPEALGRVEWIKLFGVLFDKEDEATHLFNEQKARVEQTSGLASSGKTVAYFYINSNGAAVTRRAGDYVAQMIELAGGSYALDDAQTASTSGSSVTLEMERFYATAKDADIIVYNGTIDESVATLNDFVGKNALLSQFKAVKNGNVWVTSADMYQQMTSTADIIDELHGAFTGDDASNFHYLRKLG